MTEKQAYVPSADRPPLPKPAPEKRLSELQVRDLEALLQHTHKHFKYEVVEHKHKIEKYEKIESKWEHLKAEIAKWEHGEIDLSQLIPGPGPVERAGIDHLVDVVTQLHATVTALNEHVQTLKGK